MPRRDSLAMFDGSALPPSSPRQLPIRSGRALLVILVPVLCVPAGIANPIPHFRRQPRETVQTIQKMEQRLQSAELSGNTVALKSLLAADYLGIYANGTLATREEALARIQSGAVRFTRIHTFDRKIRVHGPTVVVISEARVQGIHDGEDFDGKYRYTRVYHRIHGNWKVIHSEANAIRKHRAFPLNRLDICGILRRVPKRRAG